MNKIIQTMFAMVVLCGCAAVVAAQDAPPSPTQGGFGGGRQMQMQMPSFADLDKNKDKKLSKSEVPEMMLNFFDRLDENKDGFIDET